MSASCEGGSSTTARAGGGAEDEDEDDAGAERRTPGAMERTPGAVEAWSRRREAGPVDGGLRQAAAEQWRLERL
jgi:hypothetical protein